MHQGQALKQVCKQMHLQLVPLSRLQVDILRAKFNIKSTPMETKARQVAQLSQSLLETILISQVTLTMVQ